MRAARSRLLVVAGVLAGATATWGATLEVSQPVKVTTDGYYARGQAITYDGTDYWLFYGRSATCTGNYGNSNPDVYDYKTYFKNDPPARTFAVVGSWPMNFDIEIECVAVDPKA